MKSFAIPIMPQYVSHCWVILIVATNMVTPKGALPRLLSSVKEAGDRLPICGQRICR
jgi:hypothetical protein